MSNPIVKVNPTAKFGVLDLASSKVDHVGKAKKSAAEAASREKTRLNKESGGRQSAAGLIGGPFTPSTDLSPFAGREAIFARLWAEKEKSLAAIPDTPITITMPDGSVKSGVAFKTTPLDIATGISKGLAEAVIIAKVLYSSRLEEDKIVACDEDEEGGEGAASAGGGDGEAESGELWDLHRPLVGNCTLKLLKYDDPESQTVFWHSSAHVLGAAIEATYGAHLTIGPPIATGFYYDSYMGDLHVTEEDLRKIEDKAGDVIKKKLPFQRLVLTKAQALEMFASNPFKTALITNKVPEGAMTTVYRCGPLIDLCMGPHVPNTGKIKAFAVTKSSATNWLGHTTNDPLQRVYGIAFPEKAQLKQWQEFQEQAKQRDHRTVGTRQELFFFHQLSPGSCFWMPHGARVYNKLCEFIRKQYWERGFQEVITPNIFNLQLWEISGHAQHYKENMFTFDVEGQEWGMKPMNCPGHCLMFGHRLRSYRELPIRLADFGVLHRNEVSGALTGLTRVRRFQQDDAHIFCRQDQIKQEVLASLDFMRFVYTIFGMTYKLELSTRPAKALGDKALWDTAEASLAEALNEFAGEGKWRINAGDGAFYGPKIDIKVYDALERIHQCATVQLDFQLPIRFNLEYRGKEGGPAGGAAAGEGGAAAAAATEGGAAASGADAGAGAGAAGGGAFHRPVMVHRAMLGSVERMSAVLTEHWGGKWPLWLSPRQLLIIPIDLKYADYGSSVQDELHKAGFFVDMDDSSRTLNKKVREGQLAQYNFILVVGEKEAADHSVSVRTRDNEVKGAMAVGALIDMLNGLVAEYK